MGLECADQWALLKKWLIALFGKECDAARARAGSKGATQIQPGLRPWDGADTIRTCSTTHGGRRPMLSVGSG